MTATNAKDVVLLCNPQAGGRWRALAEVLDSPEAKGVRRIVTDDIEDVREALTSVGQRAKLLCIYGGDGTIYHIINELLKNPPDGRLPPLAFLGGGTMNVTGRMYGMVASPGENFRAVMKDYLADQLVWQQVPVVKVSSGSHHSYGFTFGMGPLVRILDRYEHGQKGKLAAVGIGLRAIASAISPIASSLSGILDQMNASVIADGVTLPHQRYIAVFANTTGAINRAIEPFADERTQDTFNFLAYAVSSRELAMLVTMLARGKLPLDRQLLRSPTALWRQLAALATSRGQAEWPRDPRYVNHVARSLQIRTDEPLYTLDGELLPCDPESPLDVALGPNLPLVKLTPIR